MRHRQLGRKNDVSVKIAAYLCTVNACEEGQTPTRVTAYIVVFGLVSLLAELFIPYTIYVKYLKWLTVSLLAYVAAAFFVHIPWGTVLSSTFRLRLQVGREYLLALMAVLGTTISSYLSSGKRRRK